MKVDILVSEGEHRAASAEPDVFDAASDRIFDDLVRTAALACETPIALITLVDTEGHRCKARVGLENCPTMACDTSFHAHLVRERGVLEVADATRDPRFADDPVVTGEPGVRFYAGVTLRLDDGTDAGSICVIDRSPGQLSTAQRAVLVHLSGVVARELEARRTAALFARGGVRHQALGEASPLGVFVTDAEGACVYTNDRWRSIFGLSPAEASGHNWSRMLHPDDGDAVFAEWHRTTAARLDFDMQFRLLHDDGSIVHVRMLARTVIAENGEVIGYIGSVENITERKLRENALRESESLLSETGALANVGGWALELDSGALLWTAQTCRIHGLEPGHVPQVDEAIEYYAPEARQTIRDAVELGLTEGRGWDLELPLIQAGGRRIWVRAVGRVERVDGKPVRLIGAIQDITERVEQRRALEHAHERMTLATESGQIGIWDWDLDSDLMSWTPQMYALFGLPPDVEPVSREVWMARIHPEDRSGLLQNLRDTGAGAASLEVEVRIVRPDGDVRHVHVVARVMRNAQGVASRMLGVVCDETKLRSLGNELSKQHELLRVTLQSIGDAVITANASGLVNWLNPVAERMTGWSSSDALGRPLAEVFHVLDEETRHPLVDPLVDCLCAGRVAELPARTILVSRTGKEFGIEESAAPIKEAGGEVLGAVLVFHDVSEQRRLSAEMSHRASHDALTELVNRAEFEIRLQRTLDAAHAESGCHTLMYIDLDRFKVVNDTCGHSAGDQLLQQVTRLLSAMTRPEDTLARIGGDEFALIMDNCAGEEAICMAQRICDRLDNFRFVHDGQRFRIGASIGIVRIDRRWADIAALMRAADASCYAAKEAGRNRVHAWFDTDKVLRQRSRETRWARRIEQAIDADRFELQAQRIEASDACVRGLHAEVLIRLRDETGELIGPAAFLPAAERFHLITRIDRWVLRRTIEQLQGMDDLSALEMLTVNLSGQSIGDRVFHRDAIEVLAAAGDAICRRLCLEITETTAVTNMTDAVAFAERVRAFGARIALDDFGAGTSSFGYLKSLPVDLLKIDGQFIQGMIEDPLDDAAVRCFVDVAHVVGVKTVAEYVDRSRILTRVRQLGIDYFQGYLIHVPEPLEQVLVNSRTVARVI